MISMVRAVVDPGSRLLVRFGDRSGRGFERIAGWLIDDAGCIAATPELTLVEEAAAGWTRVLDVTGTEVYPADVFEVEHFSRPIEDFEIADLVVRARAEAAAIRLAEWRHAPASEPRSTRSWQGYEPALPPEGGLAALRRRVTGKTSNFVVGRRGHLRGS